MNSNTGYDVNKIYQAIGELHQLLRNIEDDRTPTTDQQQLYSKLVSVTPPPRTSPPRRTFTPITPPPRTSPPRRTFTPITSVPPNRTTRTSLPPISNPPSPFQQEPISPPQTTHETLRLPEGSTWIGKGNAIYRDIRTPIGNARYYRSGAGMFVKILAGILSEHNIGPKKGTNWRYKNLWGELDSILGTQTVNTKVTPEWAVRAAESMGVRLTVTDSLGNIIASGNQGNIPLSVIYDGYTGMYYRTLG